ncbi:hypothetical protein G7077_13095 [Sphingomonas piscis]|uniref:Uncharacterized protein n=1 Tax=Sphingomonas piscis TaxID=2714943 RepID=A0A6G7YSK0_9SPHN|nr:hypothetical protein [Sphingomonas piscis]QIK79701.1 hypothetical protein G7077_13095 [Sphingomonas piscis]
MANNNNRSNRNNSNRDSRSQYTGGAVVDYARERPATAAVAAAAAVGAGVFLWSRRNQISEQLSGLSDQIGQWSEQLSSRQSGDLGTTGSTNLGNAGVGSSGGTSDL